jgi:nitroimidazol reductase NimA-like FMN-containing flavoprotein (pyridoxamine 5'-phosphate oxidase superfamily)
MRSDRKVCFEVEQIRSISNWRTVIARGLYTELGRDEEEHAMDLLAGKFAWGIGNSSDRDEAAHRREGVVRPILFQIELVERSGRFARS